MKQYNVYGLGNALVDIIVRVSEEKFKKLGVEKATMRLVDSDEQVAILQEFSDPGMASAGSVANSIYTVGQLGGRGAFSGSVADDRYGLFYKGEFQSLGITFPNLPSIGGVTGTSLIIVTPDAERTMRTNLASSSDFSEKHVDEEILKSSSWVFIEGYLLANPGKVRPWLERTISLCKKHGVKIAFTCSEAWVIQSFRSDVDLVLENADLVFANESESCALVEAKEGREAYRKMKERFPNVAVTMGEKGAIVSLAGVEAESKAFPCTPVDLTGAGDAFAGGVLYGLTHSASASECVRAGCYLASKIISHVGARYPGDLKPFWKEALGG